MIFEKIFFDISSLSVADINIVTIVTYRFCPDPYVSNVLVICIAVQSAYDISFKIYASTICTNWVIPTIYRCTVQWQIDTYGWMYTKKVDKCDIILDRGRRTIKMSGKKQNKYTVEFKKQSSICIIREKPMLN